MSICPPEVQGVQVHNNDAILRGAMESGHKFNDTTSFHENLLIEAGSENSCIKYEPGLQVKMTDALALKTGHEVRHSTEVLPGDDKADTLTTINVVYEF